MIVTARNASARIAQARVKRTGSKRSRMDGRRGAIKFYGVSVAQKILHSSNFRSRARCAPGDAKAQRAAALGKLGTIGFVLNDLMLSAHVARIPSGALTLRLMTRAAVRASTCASDPWLTMLTTTSPHLRRCCAFESPG